MTYSSRRPSFYDLFSLYKVNSSLRYSGKYPDFWLGESVISLSKESILLVFSYVLNISCLNVGSACFSFFGFIGSGFGGPTQNLSWTFLIALSTIYCGSSSDSVNKFTSSAGLSINKGVYLSMDIFLLFDYYYCLWRFYKGSTSLRNTHLTEVICPLLNLALLLFLKLMLGPLVRITL